MACFLFNIANHFKTWLKLGGHRAKAIKQEFNNQKFAAHHFTAVYSWYKTYTLVYAVHHHATIKLLLGK